MTSGAKTILIPVSDPAKAKAVYSGLLGAAPMYDEPYYVHYEVAGQQIGLVPNGKAQGMTGPVAYWHVDDIEATLATLLAAGAETEKPVGDVGGGRLTAIVKDADGNSIGLLQDPK